MSGEKLSDSPAASILKSGERGVKEFIGKSSDTERDRLAGG